METLGWIGSIMFAACGIPQAWQCWRVGHAQGLAWGFLLLWLGGEILTLVYILPKLDWPLIFNYGVNLALLLIILGFKINPRI